MTWFQTAGTTIGIGTTAFDPLLDTYSAIGEIETVPTFGDSYAKVTFTNVATRNEASRKGTRQGFDMNIPVGLDPSDVGQMAFRAACNVDAYYNFRVTLGDAAPALVAVATVTIAAPGVFTLTAHGFTTDTPVTIATNGALPTGLAVATTYFVRNPTANTFELSATRGGTVSITTTGTQSGVHTITSVPIGSRYHFKGSAASFMPNPGGVNDPTRASLVIFGQPSAMNLTNWSIVRAPNPVGV
jgi:hypothetical protein